MADAQSQAEMAGRQHGGNLQAAAAIANCSPTDIIDFSASLNPLGPPQSVWDAISASPAAVISYPDPNNQRLLKSLADHYNVKDDWIVPGNGAAELLNWAARSCSQVGSTLIPQPAFSDYARALDAIGADWEGLPFWDGSCGLLDLTTAIGDRLARPNPPSCLILTNPHNPTGHLWSSSELLNIIPHFQLVIVDEAFMDFVRPSQSLLGWVDRHPQLVVVRSLTKFFAIAGLRIGFAVTHPKRRQQWMQWRDPWSVNGLATEAAIAALSDRPFQLRTHEWLPSTREQLRTSIDRLEGFETIPSAANFLLVKTNRAVPRLQEQLLKHHKLLIRDCLSFRYLNQGYFRIAVRNKSENLKLVRSLQAELSNS